MNSVSLKITKDENIDAALALSEKIIHAAGLGMFELTVTTIVEPKDQTNPARLKCRYILDAQKPVEPSRALQSTRTGS